MKLPLQEGDIILFERRFTKEDVERFTEISRDERDHHLTQD